MMRIDASRVCKEALRQRPTDRDLGTSLVFAANKVYRKRSGEIGLAVLKLVEQYADRFDRTRLEIVEDFAEGKVTIERSGTRFPEKSTFSSERPLERLPACVGRQGMAGARELVAMGYRLLSRAALPPR